MPKIVKAVLSAFVFLLIASACQSGNSQPAASQIAQNWLDIKAKLNQTDTAALLPAQITGQIDEFNTNLGSFIDSPIGYLYQRHRKGEMRLLEITAAIDRLKKAVQDGDKQEIASSALEIDKAVAILHRVEDELSRASQFKFFLLIFFFAVLTITATLVLTALQKKNKIEKLQYSQSMSFSRDSILAQEHERTRIARELHDTVAQDVLRLSLQTELIKKGKLSETQSRLCDQVMEGQTELLSRIRGICDDLIPPDFQPSGDSYIRLPDAFQTLCDTFAKRTGINCSLTIHESADLSYLDVDKQLHCFRIVQECLANIDKHSQANDVQVLVRNNAEGQLMIYVTDNGKGIENTDNAYLRALRAKGHFGLWNMKERAASMNSKLIIDSEPGEGTTIKLFVNPPVNVIIPAEAG